MAASREDIKGWLERAPVGTTNVAVFCDTFDWEDYPVYIKASDEKDCREQVGKHKDRLMEVYSLKEGYEKQLNQKRVFNYH